MVWLWLIQNLRQGMFGMNLMWHDVVILNTCKYPVFAVVLASLYPYTKKMIDRNYRGITLLSAGGKLFQLSLIKDCTSSRRNAWHKWPHLYLKSAYWQVCKIYAKEKTKSCISCFIDFRKAFDLTTRQKLFDKLRRGGIRGLFLEVLISMYSNDKSVVKNANKLTLFSLATPG